MIARSAYCGLEFIHDVELPELPELGDASSDEPGDLEILGLEIPVDAPKSWVHDWTDGSYIVMSLAAVGGCRFLRFDDGNVFTFDRRKRTVRYPTPVDVNTRHQLLDHVLPRVLDDLGHLMIHGSAISTQSGSIVFIGDSGAGKSTLVASFASAGTEMLSDDGLRLISDPDGRVDCIPTYRSLRLWPDSAEALMEGTASEPMSAENDKLRLDLPSAPPSESTTVAAICVLTTPEYDTVSAITFSPVAPARAVSLLLAQCFRLDPTDAEATARAFQRCADVVERVPVVEISYPREYNKLSAVCDAVLQQAADNNWS